MLLLAPFGRSTAMNKDNLTINNDKMLVCAIRTKQQLAEVCI